MKTIVIPDIHNDTKRADSILSKESADEFVFLGDIFDNFHDCPQIALNTARWLAEILQRTDCVVLFGNHDVPYRWPRNRYVMCPGFTPEKCIAINSVMTHELWDKMHWVYKTQGWHLSHAGLHEKIFAHPMTGFSDAHLAQVIDEGISRLLAGQDPEHCRAGFRMGIMRVGGLTWADWSEFEPLIGINQIVGHSPYSYVRLSYARSHRDSHKVVHKILKPTESYETNLPKAEKLLSLNFCIDTPNTYAVIEDGCVSIKSCD